MHNSDAAMRAVGCGLVFLTAITGVALLVAGVAILAGL